MTGKIEFIDLVAQQARIKERLDAAIARVLAHGSYILGPEVAEFERQLCAYCGAAQAITCSNGTDAIGLLLMAWKIRPGDAIFCPSFTFASTAEVICWLGAVPVFVDINPATYNMDADSLEAAIAAAVANRLSPKAVIAVDLFGQPSDYDRIEPIVRKNGLRLICDSAQGFGGTYRGRNVGTIGDATTTSFFPAKPLGCYGDGGAVLTNDADLAATLRSLRVHGKGSDKYDNVLIGMNARLDTLQAAILIEKLAIFADEIDARNKVAERYSAELSDCCTTPVVIEGGRSVWAQYTVRVAPEQRASIASRLAADGVPTNVYYPKPLHQQTAYSPYATLVSLENSESAANSVLSLPMHSYLDADVQDHIIAAYRKAIGQV